MDDELLHGVGFDHNSPIEDMAENKDYHFIKNPSEI